MRKPPVYPGKCVAVRHRARTILFALLLVPLLGISGGIEDLAAEADRAYREGDYRAAIESYTRILESGYTGGPVLFNLGNAYYKSGELGPAILYYERALRVMPHNRDVRYNLELARGRTVDRIEPPPRLPLWDWIDALRDMVPPELLAWSAWGFALAAAISFAVMLFIRRRRTWRIARYLAIILAALFVINISLVLLRIADENRPPEAIIMQDKVVVYSAPDPSANELFHLHEGTKVTVVKELQGYREIRLVDGRQGWLEMNACEVI